MLTRHSPFGLPASGTFELTPAVKCGFGAGLRQRQHVRARIHPAHGLYLMEVPPQACPQHHGYLPSRRGCGLEVAIARTRDGRYEEVVMIQSRLPVAVGMMSLWRLLLFIIIVNFRMVLVRIFGLQNDCPAGREDSVVNVQLICLKEETAKNRSHSEGLTIGKVHKMRCHTASDDRMYLHEIWMVLRVQYCECRWVPGGQ